MWKKRCLVRCTWKWHPINSYRTLLGLAASAGVGHSLNPVSCPPSLLKAFSLMTLQRWEKVAAQKDLESKGGIDPGTRPSFLSLPLTSSPTASPFVSSPPIPILLTHISSPSLPIFFCLTLQFLVSTLPRHPPPPVLSGCSPSFSCVIEGSDVPGLRSQQWVRAYNFLIVSAPEGKQHHLHQLTQKENRLRFTAVVPLATHTLLPLSLSFSVFLFPHQLISQHAHLPVLSFLT